MADQGLVNHIRASVEKGENEEMIKTRLIEAGHSQEALEEAFVEHKNPPRPKTDIIEKSVSSAGSDSPWLSGLFQGRVDGFTWFFGGIVVSLLSGVVNLLLLVLSASFSISVLPLVLGVLFVTGVFAALVSLSLTIKRLHDKDVTGWLVLLSLIPLVNFLFFIFLIIPVSASSNSYGTRDRRSFFNRIFNTHNISNKKGLTLVLVAVILGFMGFLFFSNQNNRNLYTARQGASQAIVEAKFKGFQAYAKSEYHQKKSYSLVCESGIFERTFEGYGKNNSLCNSSDEAFMFFVVVEDGFFCADSEGFLGKVKSAKNFSCQ